MKLTTIFFLLISSLYFISCDKDVSVTPPEAPPPTGFLSVNSNPPGAEIFVNNRTTGRVTPDSLSWLAAGKYQIRLKLNYFRDTSFSVNVSEKNKVNVFVDYTAEPTMYGSIVCKSTPDHAYIILNGKLTENRTPFTFTKVFPGTYTIGFKALGCRDGSQTVVVKSGIKSEASVALKDTTEWLTFDKSNSAIPSNELTCIGSGGNGVFWIGTKDKGLVYFDGLKWKTYDPSNSIIPSRNITSLEVKGSAPFTQYIFVGTHEGLVMLLMQDTVVVNSYRYDTNNSSLPDNNVTSISGESGFFIWIGTQKGIALLPGNFDPKKMEAFTNLPLLDKSISCVAAVPGLAYNRHDAWVGLPDNGVMRFNYNQKTWSNSSSPNREVISMGVSYSNQLWAGCTKGVLELNDGSWNSFQLGSGENLIKSINVRGYETWVCTSEGLFQLSSTGQIIEYNTKNSQLPSNSISGVAFDQYGRPWITTSYNGLVLYKKKN